MTPGSAQDKHIMAGIMPDVRHDAVDVLPREPFPADKLKTEEVTRYGSVFII